EDRRPACPRQLDRREAGSVPWNRWERHSDRPGRIARRGAPAWPAQMEGTHEPTFSSKTSWDDSTPIIDDHFVAAPTRHSHGASKPPGDSKLRIESSTSFHTDSRSRGGR